MNLIIMQYSIHLYSPLDGNRFCRHHVYKHQGEDSAGLKKCVAGLILSVVVGAHGFWSCGASDKCRHFVERKKRKETKQRDKDGFFFLLFFQCFQGTLCLEDTVGGSKGSNTQSPSSFFLSLCWGIFGCLHNWLKSPNVFPFPPSSSSS